MPDENPNPEGGAQPEVAAEETFTLTRAQMDEFKARTLAEAQAAQPAAPKMDPLAAYYAGTAGRAQQKQAAQPASVQSDANDAIGRIAKLMELQLMQNLAPKPPPPPKPMSVEEKLASRDAEVLLGRGPHGWSAADAEALRAKHRAELAKAGYKGDIESEARARASREVLAAFDGLGGRIKVTI